MTKIHKIKFQPFGLKIEVQDRETIFKAAVINDILLRSDCGENGICGKCCVVVDNPEHLSHKTDAEVKVLGKQNNTDRLACQARITGHLTVTVPEKSLHTNEVHGKTGLEGSFVVNSQLSDIDQKGIKSTSLGVAFDVGTTTIAAYFCDRVTGKILTAKAVINPQCRFGEDVISRISAVNKDETLLVKQQSLAVGAMNDLIDRCIKTTGLNRDSIDEITIAGNTTMEHILAGFHPYSLGVYPYLPVKKHSHLTNASGLGLDLLNSVPIYFFPVIAGFLGGDILAACLGDQSHLKKKTSLIIDIGTNGELLLCSKGQIWASSCATGPALEGATISSGMRASYGAISKVWIDNGKIIYEVIGNPDSNSETDKVTPVGICGSGIIDIVAALRKMDIIGENGTFNKEKEGVSYDKDRQGRFYTIPESDVKLTLKDVRQVQLAKAALFVGIDSLISKSGVDKVDRTILTGAFGARFDWENARDIGMLPENICKGKITCAENLAGTGAVMALLSKAKRREVEALAKKVHFFDLATESGFTEQFAMATRFVKT